MAVPLPTQPRFYPRIWGSLDLRAWYPQRPPEVTPMGEVWLSPTASPVLVKLLFPAQPLSVQVHPDDAFAAAHRLGRGKTEMWCVLEAQPGARLGVGLRPGTTLAEMEAACRINLGTQFLDWIPVTAGDVIYVPAGTVHAVGVGVVLAEVQQNSDTTFRLDDYGRLDAAGHPRTLHIEEGFAVARLTSGGRVEHGLSGGGSGVLVRCPYFEVRRQVATDHLELAACDHERLIVNIGPSLALLPRGYLLSLPAGTTFAVDGPAALLDISPL